LAFKARACASNAVSTVMFVAMRAGDWSTDSTWITLRMSDYIAPFTTMQGNILPDHSDW
jgi:hypothetical protein